MLIVSALAGCASLPPGGASPKSQSTALAHPEDTRLGRRFAGAAREHAGNSGYRMLSVGVDGFLTRVQAIDAAERTIDLQYYIFHEDQTGQLIADSLLRAAGRGVRVRILVDDGETVAGDERLLTLDGRDGIEVRVFNPFEYRGHNRLMRTGDFLLHEPRLDYRMHNKLLVVDNAIALIGGRNIGDQYFQVDPESQFADDDVFVAGPVTKQLSEMFDEFWNGRLAVPAAALAHAQPRSADPPDRRQQARARRQQEKAAGIDYVQRIATGEPFDGLISGRLPLSWSHARFICDSADKKHVLKGEAFGNLMYKPVADAVAETRSELLMVTPYFVPTDAEKRLLIDLRHRGARVRILTNSLEAAPELSAHSGYKHYRAQLLQEGVELYEARSLLGNARGSGQTARISRFGNYALHAKLYVFDRGRVVIGSMNFDQRSNRLNTEDGLIIDSAEIATQVATRFEAMTTPENAYSLALRADARGKRRLTWRTVEQGKTVEYTAEPARSAWEKMKVELLSLLPLDREL